MRAYRVNLFGAWHLSVRTATWPGVHRSKRWERLGCGMTYNVDDLQWQDADAVHPDDRCKHPGCAKAWAEFDRGRS